MTTLTLPIRGDGPLEPEERRRGARPTMPTGPRARSVASHHAGRGSEGRGAMEDQDALITGDHTDRPRITALAMSWGFPPLEREAVDLALTKVKDGAKEMTCTLGVATVGDVTQAAIAAHVWTALNRIATRRGFEDVVLPPPPTPIVDASTGRQARLRREAPDHLAMLQHRIDRGPGASVTKTGERRGHWPLVRFHIDFVDHRGHLKDYRGEVHEGSNYDGVGRPVSLAFIEHDLSRHDDPPQWVPDERLYAMLHSWLRNDLRDAWRRERRQARRDAKRGPERARARSKRHEMLQVAITGRPGTVDPADLDATGPRARFILRLAAWLEGDPTGLNLTAFASNYEREHGEPPPGLRERLLMVLGLWSCDRLEFGWLLPDGETILDDPRQLTDGSHERLVQDLGAWVAGPEGTLGEPQGPSGDGGLRDAMVTALASVKSREKREALTEVLLCQSVGVDRARDLHREAFGTVPSARSVAIRRFAEKAALEDVLHRHLFQKGCRVKKKRTPCPCHRSRSGGNP